MHEQARSQVSDLEVQKQQVLGELYKQEEMGRRQAALGKPYAPLTEEKAGVESKAVSLQEATKAELNKALADLKSQADTGKSTLSKWKETSLTSIAKAEADFKAANVELSTGEWVSKKEFNALSPTSQAQLKKLGVDQFNATIEKEKQQFEANNIQLKTEEWVAKTDYNALSSADQAKLMALGVAAFNAQKTVEHNQFEATYTEVKPGVWYAKSEWGALTPSQQQEVLTTGSYTIIPATGQEALQQLIDAGKVPKYAVLTSYDSSIGQVSYKIPPWKNIPIEDIRPSVELRSQLIQQFASLDRYKQNEVMIAAYGSSIPVPITAKDIERQITQTSWGKDFWDRTLSFYQSQILSSPDPAAALADIHKTITTQGAFMLTNLVPIYGTIRNWDNMSPIWRGISIAADIAIIVPYVRAGLRALIEAKIPFVVATEQLARAELASVKEFTRLLATTYGRDVAASFTKTEKALTIYIKQLGWVEQAGAKVSTKLLDTTRNAEQSLRTAAKNYVDILSSATSRLKGIKDIPIGIDDPQVAAMLRNLPNDIVENAKAAVAGLKPGNLDVLRDAVTRAQKDLKTVKTAHPTEPAMWVSAAQQLGKAQARLTMAETGNASRLLTELTGAHEALKGVQTALETTTDLKEITKLQGELERLRVQVKQLEAGYKEALYNAESQWTEMGSKFEEWRTGGIATEVKPKASVEPPILGSPARLRTAPTVAGIAATAKVLAIKTTAGVTTPEVVKETPEVGPEVTMTPEVIEAAREVAEVSAITIPEVISITEVAVRAATEAALKGMSMPDIKNAVRTASEIEVQHLIDTEALTQTEAETLTKTVTEVATRVATKTKVRVEIEEKLRTQREEKEKKKKKKKTALEVPDGTWTWKQGFGWRWFPPPYDAPKPFFSFQPPAGAINTNLRTPAETIQIIGDSTNVPDNIGIDLGVVDILLTKKPKPTITFRGRGLKTQVGGRIPSTVKGLGVPAKWGGSIPSIAEPLAKLSGLKLPEITLPGIALPEIKLPSPWPESARLSYGPYGSGQSNTSTKKEEKESQPELTGMK